MKPFAQAAVLSTDALFSLSPIGGEGRGEGEACAVASGYRFLERVTPHACLVDWNRFEFASRPLTLSLSPDGGEGIRHGALLHV